MTVAFKNKGPVMVSLAALRRAGFKNGQELEVKASDGIITISPKLSPDAEEYTPAQRRAIDARLNKSLDEVRRGHIAGPFDTADEMIASLKRKLGRPIAKKTKVRAR